MIKLEIETALWADVFEYVKNQLEYANTCGSNDQERLDHMAHVVRMKYKELWTYRGGNHVAIHYLDKDGSPVRERTAIIRPE